MAMNLLSYDHEEDDYIDIEISSFSNFFSHSKISSPQTREFEFQMSSFSLQKDSTTSPADELFYKGKLLPLHLPPRLEMVEKLLENSNSVHDFRKDYNFEEFYSTPLMATTNNTPFQSCKISPSESCQVSMELNPDEYFSEYPNEVSDFIGENSKKSAWSKKIKLIKQSPISSKLKASRAYLKSLFGKSGCSNESCTAATKVADEEIVSKSKKSLEKYENPIKKSPFGQIQKEKKIIENGNNGRLHRRSFSMAIKRNSTNKFSSSSSSSSSGSSSSSSSSLINTNNYRFNRLPFLKRSSSVNSEIENPIQGAIAHCKQSHQQLFCSRKSATEVGFYSLSSASKVALCEEQERHELCRG